MIGNEEDFTACLGLEVEGADANLTRARHRRRSGAMIERAAEEFPNFTGHRDDAARRAQRDGQRLVGAIAWMRDEGFVEATAAARARDPRPRRRRRQLRLRARLRLPAARRLQLAVEYGAAHGALAMTTPGDTSMASLAEVEALMRGASARVQR